MTENDFLNTLSLKRLEYEREKIALQQELEQLEKKLQAIKILGGFPDKPLIIASGGKEKEVAQNQAKPVVRRKSRKGMTEKCLRIINSTDEVLRPIDVLKRLENSGYKFKCKKPMNSISPALRNLATYGEIIRIEDINGKGCYRRKDLNKNGQ